MEENAGQKDTASTTIGHTIVIRGKLKSAEDLIVHGRIDAEISSEKSVMIANEGIVKAAVRAESLSVSGILVGDAQAESRMELSSGGRMVGDILSPKVVISDGAAFRGRIDMSTFDGPRSAVESLPAEPATPQPLNGASSNGASVRPPAVPIDAVATATAPEPPAPGEANPPAPAPAPALANEAPAESSDAEAGDEDDGYGLLGLGRKNRRKKGRF